MNRILIALIAAATLVAGAAIANPQSEPTTKRAAANAWSDDGLQQKRVKGLDLVYVRPGAELSGYRRVLINPVSVAFRRDWERHAAIPTGSRIPTGDTLRIKDDLAQVVHDQVVRELSKSGYALATAPGEDVLEINVRVAELYLNAPDIQTAAPTHSYTMSFGEMTMIAELRDSTSGATLMRIFDRTIGRDLGILRLTTRVENASEVGNAASAWARALRRELDLARGIRG